MIITRAPLRITLGGGGTDLPSYYKDHGGFLIAGAIDKYVYITLHQTFEQELILKYSKLERVKGVQDLQHPIVRETLKLFEFDHPHLEITSMADIPAGTGLGSSGSFTVALIKALHAFKKNLAHRHEIAELACQIELEKLKEPIGKQDQYIAAIGGLTCFQFHPDGKVDARPLKIPEEARYNLEDNLLLFYTNTTRSASEILKDQDQKSQKKDSAMIDNLHWIKKLGQDSCTALEKGDLKEFAKLMDVHWEHKKARSSSISNAEINECYEFAKKNGALGGKLIGAGGGGFLMFYTEEKTRLRRAFSEKKMKEVRFKFDFEGVKTVIES